MPSLSIVPGRRMRTVMDVWLLLYLPSPLSRRGLLQKSYYRDGFKQISGSGIMRDYVLTGLSIIYSYTAPTKRHPLRSTLRRSDALRGPIFGDTWAIFRLLPVCGYGPITVSESPGGPLGWPTTRAGGYCTTRFVLWSVIETG